MKDFIAANVKKFRQISVKNNSHSNLFHCGIYAFNFFFGLLSRNGIQMSKKYKNKIITIIIKKFLTL
jgi:hypothetical protein